MLLRRESALLISLALLGCAGPETQLPATTRVLDDLPKVQNSPRAPCWMQQQVAAQNSYLATIRERRETVYKAPCEVDKPKVKPASTS